MKIKLIFAPFGYDWHKIYFPPLGLAQLSSFLVNNGFKVSIDDLEVLTQRENICNYKIYNYFKIFDDGRRVSKSLDGGKDDEIAKIFQSLFNKINLKGINLVGFSQVEERSEPIILALSKMIKDVYGDVPILVGGYKVHKLNLRMLKSPHINYIITGEGEIPILKIAHGIENGNIKKEKLPGLIFKDKNNSIRVNKGEQLPMDDKPCPNFDNFSLDLYKQKYNNKEMLLLPYNFIRGCNNCCSFCAYQNNAHFSKNILEIKSFENIASDLKELYLKYKTRYFTFMNNTFNISKKFVKSFSENIIKENLDIFWSDSARPTDLTRELSKQMYKSGCRRLTFGVESGSNRILKAMDKNFTIEQTKQTIKNTSNAGIWNHISLILGYLHETKVDNYKTVSFIKETLPYIDEGGLGPLVVFHGSQIQRNPEKFGITNLRPSHPGSMVYKYDEINGLKWEQKEKQHDILVKKACIFFKKYIPKDYLQPFIYYLYSIFKHKRKVKTYLKKNPIPDTKINFATQNIKLQKVPSASNKYV